MKRFFWLISLLALPGLAQVTDLSKSPLAGHVNEITTLAYHPNGDLIASGSQDNIIKLWDIKSGKVIRTLTGHAGAIASVRFTASGKFLVSGSAVTSTKSVIIWDAQTGQLIRKISAYPTSYVEVVDQDRLLALVSPAKPIQLIDMQTGKLRFLLDQVKVFGTRHSTCTSISYNSKMNRLAVGYGNNTIGIWDVATGKLLRIINKKENEYTPVESVSFNEDGQKIASSHKNVIHLWEIATGKILQTQVYSEKNTISQLCFANNDQYLLFSSKINKNSAGTVDSLNIWNLQTGTLHQRLPININYQKSSFIVNSNGSQIAAIDSKKQTDINIWDIASGQLQQTVYGLGQIGDQDASDFNTDGKQIAIAGRFDVTCWNTQTGQFQQHFYDQKVGNFESIAFSPSGNQFISAIDRKNDKGGPALALWEINADKFHKRFEKPYAGNSITFSNDGLHIIAGHARGFIIWDNQLSKVTYSSPTLPSVMAIGMGTNSNQLVFATWWKESLQLWDIALNKSVVTIPITSNVCKITYTPNDRYVLVQGFDNLIEIRDAKTLKLIQTLDQVGFFTDANFKAPKTPDGLYEIYPYFRSVFLKKVAGSPVVAALPKTAQPPTISWELPGRSDETVASNAFGVKACITGDGITAHQLYLNGEPVSLRGFKRLGCPLGIDQVLTLRIGPNELYLTATTAAGTVSSERRYVTYQPPAPSPLTVQTAPQQKRLALVIGNARYQHAGSLANPVNDALALKAVLEECGFTVLYYADLDKKGMVTAFQEFGLKLKAYNVGLVFYAGHGLSIRGMNYFLPTDANPQSEDEVEFEGIPTTRLIRKMEEANRLTNIILFDACRDNPFARTWGRGLGDSGGFALLPPPKGTLIAYAASDGEAARDRAKTGTNSPFTKALVKYIRQGGLSLSQILQRVRTEVENETAERQTTQDVNMMRDDFYFR